MYEPTLPHLGDSAQLSVAKFSFSRVLETDCTKRECFILYFNIEAFCTQNIAVHRNAIHLLKN